MKESTKNTPPRWAQRLLEWYCKPELLEDLQGDLNEYFDRHVKSRGARRARFIYIIDVFKFFRLYTVRKPKFINLLIQWIMIGSYIKTSGRSLVRNKLFSTINIFGLAISMSVGLMLIGVLMDAFSYDRFHSNYSHIYRVLSQYQYLDNKDDDFYATTSMKTAKAIEESFTGHEGVAILRRGFEGDVSHEETTVPLRGYWANNNLFKVFSFPLAQGNAETALKEPFTAVITETTAKKLFGDKKALGETIIMNRGDKRINDQVGQNEYTITGIAKDIPEFSHMHFDMLGSLSTREITEKENKNEMAWDNIWSTWVYVLMPEQPDLDGFQNNLNQLSAKEDLTVKNTHITMKLQPLGNIMVGENLSNQMGRTLGKSMLWIFLGLTFVVILSACFNYTNLSIARALRRSKEVGIRKVIGAVKGNVVGQFVTEAVIIALLSLVASVLMFIFLKPYFLGLNPDLQELLRLELSPSLILYFVLFAVVIGMAAGFFPALFFSKINAVQVLKGTPSVRFAGKLTTRKVLIVFQYSISLMLITGTLIMYKQYHHFLNFDLGYNTHDILNIRLQGNNPDLLMKELNELPEVKNISKSSMVTSTGNYWGENMKNPNNPDDSAGVRMNRIDENYLQLHDFQLLAGRTFNFKPKDAIENEVIVNEQVLKRFNIADQIPSKAIGQVVKIDNKELTIIGVIKNFQYGRANNKSGDEVVLRYIDSKPDYLNVKINTADVAALNEKIKTIWKRLDSIHEYQAKLYDEQIKEGFRGLDASMKLAGFIAFLAIVIASLGMLGMVVFTTETRVKEVSIRKVLGASEARLLYLLGKGFFLLLLIAAGIALPTTYLFFEKLMLPMIANHVPIALNEMTVGVLAVMVIALVMIGVQTIKVARSNPAAVLKNE
jgi:ABC-type antimicrobial peptide transport system permease subunit